MTKPLTIASAFLSLLVLLLVVLGLVFLRTPYDPQATPLLFDPPPPDLQRTIEHHSAGNITTFTKTSHDTDGAYTLLDIELAPGGENAPHYHGAFTEIFHAQSGTLGLTLDDDEYLLEEGETARAEPGTSHNFFNPSDESIHFQVRIEPAHTGFERALYLLYGLDRDGQVDDDGFDDIRHAALFIMMSDTHGDGALRLLRPLLNRIAGRAQQQGLEQELLQRYVVDDPP